MVINDKERKRAMSKKLWQAEGVRNHLLAAKTGMRSSIPAALMRTNNGYYTAYCEGAEAVLAFLAEQFGINLNGEEPVKKTQTGELRLRTWTLKDIERNLQVAWLVLHGGVPLPENLEGHLKAYHQGIRQTLLALALSFDLKAFTLSV